MMPAEESLRESILQSDVVETIRNLTDQSFDSLMNITRDLMEARHLIPDVDTQAQSAIMDVLLELYFRDMERKRDAWKELFCI